MRRQRFLTGPAILLLACLAVLPACKKNKPSGGGGGTEPTPSPSVPSAAVTSDYILFAQLRAKDITDSAIFSEIMQAVAKAGGKAEWDKMEAEAIAKIGIKPTDIDTVTICIPEAPKGGLPKFVAFATAKKTINKNGLTKLLVGPEAKAEASGFYTMSFLNLLLHFPDDKTVAVLHPDLKQKYLDGYAKNRTGWPMTASLTKAAAGHTLFAAVQMQGAVQGVPPDVLNAPEAREFKPLLAAQSLVLTADLKGKDLSVAARATFPDAAAAGNAKGVVQKYLGMAVSQVEAVMNGKGPRDFADFGEFMPAVKEAHRALKEAKVEVSGSDLIVSGSYKANFDIGAMVANAVPKMQASAQRMTAQNNLKQIGLALHNYASTYGNQVPVYAVGAKGQPLKNAADKPLLSWRVALLPYVDQQALYNQFKLDEPWDSPNNKKLIEQMPKIYAPVNKPGKPGYTHLQMAIGPNALSAVGTRIPASFPDGMSNTIAVSEAAEPVIWTKPDDVMLSGKELPKNLKKKFGGQFPGGFNVLMWDGSVRFVKDTISEKTLGLALNPRDGQPLGNDW
jgi:prepilin-type processing-associated H-X9-DG protein